MNWKMKLFSMIKATSFLLMFFLSLTACKQPGVEEAGSRVATLPYFEDPSYTPHWLAPKSQEANAFHTIPDFTLVNQLGDTITQEVFEDKIYVTDFFFTTCPGICPKLTTNMSQIQEAFKDDDNVLLLSHSATPEIDSVALLNTYAVENDIMPNKWHLATGDRKQIYDLGRSAYFIEEDLGVLKDENDFLHTENFVLIDQDKHIRGIYNGLNKTSVAQLIADIKALKKEL